MAANDVIIFEQLYHDLGAKVHAFASDELKVSILDNSITLSAALADPHFGGSGTTDLSAAEVSAGGNYTAGGKVVQNQLWSGGALDFDDLLWSLQASSPTDAYYLLLYNNTAASKKAILVVDLGGPIDMTAANVPWTVAAAGGLRIKLD